MALSKDEQRTLDEIERALRDEDPTFVNTVSFDHLRRRRAIVAGFGFLIGMLVMVTGAVASPLQLALGVLVSLTGFLAMLAAIAWFVRRSGRR